MRRYDTDLRISDLRRDVSKASLTGDPLEHLLTIANPVAPSTRRRRCGSVVAPRARRNCLRVASHVPGQCRSSAAQPPAVPTATAARPDIPAQYQNPYVRFGDLSVVVDILVRITGSEEVVNSLKAKGLQGTYTIAANRDFYRGPIVDVAAESTSKAAPRSTTPSWSSRRSRTNSSRCRPSRAPTLLLHPRRTRCRS